VPGRSEHVRAQAYVGFVRLFAGPSCVRVVDTPTSGLKNHPPSAMIGPRGTQVLYFQDAPPPGTGMNAQLGALCAVPRKGETGELYCDVNTAVVD
jgi:hypothetical protein